MKPRNFFLDIVSRTAGTVTKYNKSIILIMLVLTAGVAVGTVQDQGESQSANEDVIEGTEVKEASDYLDEVYIEEGSGDKTSVNVYITETNDSILTASGLLTSLELEKSIKDKEKIGSVNLSKIEFQNPGSIVAKKLSESPDPSIDSQISVIENATSEEIRSTVESVFEESSNSELFLPTDYERGTTESSGMRVLITVEDDPNSTAGPGINEIVNSVDSSSDVNVFTQRTESSSLDVLNELMWLVLPILLLVLIVILGFAYKDVTDLVVSFIGVIATLIWTLGLMGWLGLLNQQTGLIVPILSIALSIDFSFHVFMRYREYRDKDESITSAMKDSTSAVLVAFLLVTVTAFIGFSPNILSPVSLIVDLAIALILSVVSAFIVFTTLVPALKTSLDGIWERFGADRTGNAIGEDRYVSRLLGFGTSVSSRFPLAVIVIALILALVGGIAFTELDREQTEIQNEGIISDPGWQSELPDPVGYSLHETEAAERLRYIQDNFRSGTQDTTSTFSYTQFLVRDANSSSQLFDAIREIQNESSRTDNNVVFKQGEEVNVRSPISAMQQTAAKNPNSEFAEEFANSTGEPTNNPSELSQRVPKQNIENLTDEFFETAPDTAGNFIEQSNNNYESVRVLVPVKEDASRNDRTSTMTGIENKVESVTSVSVTPVGTGTISDAFTSRIVEGITTTVMLALIGVILILAIVFKAVYKSATLGIITGLPVGLTLVTVFVGMLLLDIPLTANTALITSIAIGLGIDYNIHIGDRFASELESGNTVEEALEIATIGTGGALLGSVVTSSGAFAILIVAPIGFLQTFGTIVSVTLISAFIYSVFVLPSILYYWADNTKE